MGKIWELDYYSRPILDENQKKQWEVLICETPTTIERSPDTLFRYSQFCANTTVNSIWLKEAIEKAIAESGEAPQKIRFFRRQMNNMITKACEDAGISPSPSRRTYTLTRWIEERMRDFYPNQAGYDEKSAQSVSVQYPPLNPTPLPDAVKGDRGDRWTFVTLEASAFTEMEEWDIDFGEAFPLSLTNVTTEMKIPGVIIFSPRSLPLSAWMSGLELSALSLDSSDRSFLRLETGMSESWILANITNPSTLSEAKNFENAKKQAHGVHFVAIQSNPEVESFAGFWLLWDQRKAFTI